MRTMLRQLAAGCVLFLLACGGPDPADGVSSTSEDEIRGDKEDPKDAKGDRIADTVTIYGRKIVLHISDPESTAWAAIEGEPGDEVWLDRSFDSGVTWRGPLGRTDIPSNRQTWRTMMFKVHDRGARFTRSIGAVRACGKAGNRAEIVCTQWFRSTENAGTPLAAAVQTLASFYEPIRGRFEDGWWTGANALTTVLDYKLRTGDPNYGGLISASFDRNRELIFQRNFINEFVDDTGWWGLAWIRAFDVTGERRYLDMAKRNADFMWSYKDDKCGGGIWWRVEKQYKNAIPNELFIKLAASIYNRGGGAKYLAQAKEIWAWFQRTGMINGEHLINDGLDFDTCKNNGQVTWTYNQGVILGGLAELHRATNDATYLTEARSLADASTTHPYLHLNGVLREPCEHADCGFEAASFKGAYIRNLGELDRALPDRPYRAYLNRQAAAVRSTGDSLARYGVHWGQPIDRIEHRRQHSAVDALVAGDR